MLAGAEGWQSVFCMHSCVGNLLVPALFDRILFVQVLQGATPMY